MSSEFSVDFTKFYRPLQSVADTSEEWGPFNKKELFRFFYIEITEQTLEEQRSQGEKKIKCLDVVATVILVFTRVISVLLPLAICYCPAWVPWGIGLPLVLILSIVRGKLNGKVEVYRRENEYVPYLKEFLKHYSVKKLHPVGEWDLPKLDERLKSDLMMKEELQKRHPKSAKRIKRTVERHDLEMTPFVQQYAACRFAGMQHMQAKWAGIRKVQGEAASLLRKGDLVQFEKKHCEALQAAYETLNAMPLNGSDFPALCARDQVESVVSMYGNFCRLFPEVDALFKEGELLYAGYAFLEEAERTYASWQDYLQFAKDIKGKMTPLVHLLERSAPPASADEILEALSAIQENQLRVALWKLIDQTREIKKQLKGWIERHPLRCQVAIDQKMQAFDEQEVLSKEDLRALATWIRHYPRNSEKKCVEIPKNVHFPKKIREWLESHPGMRFKTAVELFEASFKLREALEKAKPEWTKIMRTAHAIDSEESYQNCFDTLGHFRKEILEPLQKLIMQAGAESRIKVWLRAMFLKTPALPFDQEKPKGSLLRRRKVEELRLNELLRAQDSKMLWANRWRKIAVQTPIYLLLAVEAIFALYFTTPWFYWGCCFATVVLGAISYYVDYRLKKMDREKQAIKLQAILRDHPDIGVVPGTRPQLAELKKTQQRYGLDGVASTWAKTLMEGDKALHNPNSIEEAKKFLSDLASEGGKKSTSYLENRLILLYSQYREMDPKSSQGRNTRKSIFEIEKSLLYSKYLKMDPNSEAGKETRKRLLKMERRIFNIECHYPDPSSKKGREISERLKQIELSLLRKPFPEKTVSAYEKLMLKRNQVDAKWDRVGEKIMALNKRRTEYLSVSKKFEALPKKMERLRTLSTLLKGQLALMASALEGGHERNAVDAVEEILAETKEILKEIGANGRSEEKDEQLKQRLERLQMLPQEVLLQVSRKMEFEIFSIDHELFRIERLLVRLQNDENFMSKTAVDEKVGALDHSLQELEQKRLFFKEKYNLLSQKIKELGPSQAIA
jgi:hypothetical protein